MNIESLWTEIEAEQAWRQGELRFLQNQLNNLATEGERDVFRRSMVLILYAHFEGFCSFAFELYVGAINNANIACADASYAIAAAALADMFRALRDTEKKCREFQKELPDDAKLHRFARDREFIERVADLERRKVIIPDYVVDSESNLTPIVLRKNLYRVGLPFDHFRDREIGGERVEAIISRLLEYRNKIGHGEQRDGITEKAYQRLRDTTFLVMSEVKRLVMNALADKSYLRLSDDIHVMAPTR